jgi:hypothetical protein
MAWRAVDRRWQVRADLKRPGLQGHQRDPVRQHVVHLDRNRGPLRAAGLPDHQVLCRLGLPYLLP